MNKKILLENIDKLHTTTIGIGDMIQRKNNYKFTQLCNNNTYYKITGLKACYFWYVKVLNI